MTHREIKRERKRYAHRDREKKRETETEGGREDRFAYYEKVSHDIMEAEIFHKARVTRTLLVSFRLRPKS